MKKFILLGALAICALISLNSCSSCGNKENTPSKETISKKGKLVVENIISSDREYMFLNYGGDYRWFETCIVLKDWLDSEECDGSVTSVSNVFQVVIPKTPKSADVNVILFAHTEDADTIDIKNGFWIEDYPLEKDSIKLTYKDAFERVMQVNSPKPHSKHCILRKPIGPKDCNPQWVFGNIQEQLWVDAITGEVKNSNPAFEGFGFKMPLGEWP